MLPIYTGILAGILTFAAFVFLIEKMPRIFKKLIFKHYLLSDIGFTLLAFMALPVVGSATLISTSIFCILFSVYLNMNHSKPV